MSRFLCATAVIALHCNLPFCRLNWTFVDYFFVLSGFVMYPHYNDNRINFLKNRLKRLYTTPVLTLLIYFSILATLQFSLFSTKIDLLSQKQILNLIPALLLMQTFYSASLSWDGPLWSLSAEVLVTLLTILVFRHKLMDRFIFMSIFLGFIAGIIFNLFIGLDNSSILASMLLNVVSRCLYGYALGMLIRKISYNYQKKYSSITIIATIFLMITLSLLVADFTYNGKYIYSNLINSMIYSIIIYLISQLTLCNIIIEKFYKMLGKWSFSIYVIHAPFLNIIQLLQNNFHTNFFNSKYLTFTTVFISSCLFAWLIDTPIQKILQISAKS